MSTSTALVCPDCGSRYFSWGAHAEECIAFRPVEKVSTPRSPKPTSQCGRLLALLSDGQWHHHHELYELRIVGHSRISELRHTFGCVIETRTRKGRDGTLYEYRLKVAAEEPRTVVGSPPFASSAASTPFSQLTFEEAAA